MRGGKEKRPSNATQHAYRGRAISLGSLSSTDDGKPFHEEAIFTSFTTPSAGSIAFQTSFFPPARWTCICGLASSLQWLPAIESTKLADEDDAAPARDSRSIRLTRARTHQRECPLLHLPGGHPAAEMSCGTVASQDLNSTSTSWIDRHTLH